MNKSKQVNQLKVKAKKVTVETSKSSKKNQQKRLKIKEKRDVAKIEKHLALREHLRQMVPNTCEMDPSSEGWFYKYLDPAGATETGRDTGEFSKIPDGLCPFSVDAEIRVENTISSPVPLPSTTGDPIQNALAELWSLYIVSYPLYRYAFFAIANIYNNKMSSDVQNEFADSVNTVVNIQSLINNKDWIPFGPADGGWYWQIYTLPPTYDGPITQNLVSNFRLSYKGLRVIPNFNELLNTGVYWGGHYALSPKNETVSIPEDEPVQTVISLTNVISGTPSATAASTIAIPGLPQQTVQFDGSALPFSLAPSESPTSPGSFYLLKGSTSVADTLTWTYQLPPETTIFNVGSTDYSIFARRSAENNENNEITFTITDVAAENSVKLTMSSNRAGSVPIITSTPNRLAGSNGLTYITFLSASDIVTDLNGNVVVNNIELPAMSTEQITANNPQFKTGNLWLDKGVYGVHRKFGREPVFTMTNANTFGPLQLFREGDRPERDPVAGQGIFDVIDNNFSTLSIAMEDMNRASSVVVIVWQGWEGIANQNTAVGQFGHKGLKKNTTVLELADSLNEELPGVYRGEDNDLAAIAGLAASILSNLGIKDATLTALGTVAKRAVSYGVNWLNGWLNPKEEEELHDLK